MTIGVKQSNDMGGAPAFTDQHAAKYLQRGFKALMARNFNDAGAAASLVLKYKPRLPEAHFLVGLIAIDTSEWGMARKAFSTVVNIKDDHAAAWSQLARVFVMTGNYNGAHDAVSNAVKHGSNDPLVQDVVGTVYTLMGDQEAALSYFDKSCKNTKNPMFMMNRARCLVFLGKFKEARTVLEHIMEIQPQNTQAHWTLSKLEKATDQNHVDEMLGLLENFQESSPPTAYLYYGLGKEYEDLEMWPEAFMAYEGGAKARRKHVTFDEEGEIKAFAALEKNLTKEWLDKKAGEGNASSSPIFIIGQPRTGTTLVERIITARDDVHSAGELQLFGLGVKRMSGATQSGMISAETAIKASGIDPKKLGDAYMENTRQLRSNLPRFVDKLPVNYLYAPLIAAALPNAKIIHVKRDPMDSCFSSFKQFFAEAYYHSYDLGEMARHHVRYRKLMDHYREILGDRMLEVSYEDVVEDMETQARRIIEFLDLDWQDVSLEFHKQKTAVTTASATQVREKAHNRSVGKWRQFEQELEPMKRILSEAGILSK